MVRAPRAAHGAEARRRRASGVEIGVALWRRSVDLSIRKGPSGISEHAPIVDKSQKETTFVTSEKRPAFESGRTGAWVSDDGELERIRTL